MTQSMRCLVSTISILVAALVTACGGNDAKLGVPPTVCSRTAVNVGPSPQMEPGGDCIGCHSSGEGPRFLFAGTVMGATNDDTNCAGVQGVTVNITGADGQQIQLTSNESGNFYFGGAWPASAFPYTAEIVYNGVTASMLTARSSGETNCASCHTAQGLNGAPGRIVAPQ